jgi:hydrogenase 3 maturation protease
MSMNIPSFLRETFSGSNTKIVFVGIGSELRGDDAVGVVIVNRPAELAKAAECHCFLFINGGSAPENILGEIRTFQPEIVVFIDAAVLGGTPGTVKLIDTSREKITGISFCTHTLPLAIVADYLRQAVSCEIFVIGIEPGNTDFNADSVLTPFVARAGDELVEGIAAFAGLNRQELRK